MTEREVRYLNRMLAVFEAAKMAGKRVRLAVVEEVLDTDEEKPLDSR